MNIKFFGQFLLEKSLINREQLLNALSEQRKSSPLLGDIAIEKGFIDTKQSEKINAEQHKQDKQFGQIAISLGFLSTEQVDDLLSEQRSRRKYLGEILVENNYLSEEQVSEQLKLHQDYVKRFTAEVEHVFNDGQLGKNINIINEIFTRFYPRIVKTGVSTVAVTENLSSNEEQELLFWGQDIESEQANYRLVLSLPKEHACYIGTKFLKMDIVEMDELGIDAMCEFLNTLIGHIYTRLENVFTPKVQPPKFYENRGDLVFDGCKTVTFDSGEFQINVSLLTQ